MMTLCARSGDHRSRILRVELPMTYPPTAKGDVVETLHGVAVPDPYRPLEDANSPETKAWVEAQNALSGSYLKAIPERERIAEGLTKLWNFERFSGVERAGEKVFYYRNDGLQNQAALYVTDDPAKDGRVLLDPNLLSDDGTVALGGTSITRDGRLLAYALSVGGSDWHTWRVRDVATREDLPDVIAWSKFSGASWDHDGAGFYYSAYDAPKPGEALQEANYDQKLYYHRLGTPQGDDLLVYARPDRPEWGFGGEVTEDGRFLVVTVWHGTQRENRVFLRDLRAEGAEVEPLLDEADASYAFLGNDGDRLLFRTDKDAPTGRIVAVRKGGEMETVVPAEGQAIQSAAMAGGSLFVTRLEDATSAVAQYDLQGTPIRKVELPGLGTARVGGAYADEKDLFYTYTSYTSPPTVYRLDVETGASKPFRTPEVAFDAAAYETRRLFYASKDGTRIPLFVTCRKGLTLDGENPTLLYAYGGFNISMTPGYSSSVAEWLAMGGVFAVACIRGGGEYGKAWHDGGRLRNKQNCYDDFIAAGEYLIAEGYTSTPKLACQGGSNGGLLVGAVVNQRPDLWAAALPEVGVMDLFRFHKFTIGWGWVSDFGSPDSAEDFPYILKISPLHNVRPGTRYPAVLAITGDHDDRVVPAHSYKYVAAMQAAQAGPAPILIRIETAAGHGAGKPTAKLIDEVADKLAFLAKNLGMKI